MYSEREREGERERGRRGRILIVFLLGIFIFVGSVSSYTNDGSAFYCGNSTMTADEICDDCELALNNNTYHIVYLNASSSGSTQTYCINQPANFQDKVFDCKGNSLIGNGTNGGIFYKINDTIRNCKLFNFSTTMRNTGNLSDIKIINNTISPSSGDAIYLMYYGSNVLIANNTINSSNRGIYVWSNDANSPENFKIYGNNITNTTTGIEIYNLNNSEIYNNIITASSYGIYLHTSSSSVNSYNNSMFNNKIYTKGITLSRSLNSRIFNNSIYNGGITLSYFSNSRIFNNSLEDSTGISASSCSYVNITENNITVLQSGDYGINVGGSNILMKKNNIHDSAGRGIYVGAGSNNSVLGNIIHNVTGRFGIYVASQVDCEISHNHLSNLSLTTDYIMLHVLISNNTLINNNTLKPNYYKAMELTGKNFTITNNTVSESNNNIHGGVYVCIEDSLVESNNFWNLDFCSTNSGVNIIVRDNIIAQLELKVGLNNTIIYNNFNGELSSISTYSDHDCYGNNISYNTFSNFTPGWCGGAICSSTEYKFYNNTIAHNVFSNITGYGIKLLNATDNIIENNTMTNISNDDFSFGSDTSNNKGCGNNGSITDLGTNYVSNISQACYIWKCENLDDIGRLNGNGTYILGQNISGDNCMSIESNDTILDGNSYAINGTGYGILLNTITNVFIKHLTILDFSNFIKTYSSPIFNLNNISLENNNTLNFDIESNDGINLTMINWTTNYKQWNETCSNSTASVNHAIGDFSSGDKVVINKNSSYWNTFTAN